ncbi:MAG TPA: sulfotransferase domain-containing protein [Caulobacteraceae bacterium]|nr:sulfotransferase domain-containing protein [Caulobacteraceae bacterium]
MLPNFLILGAQKAGTTTMWDRLRKSPDVYFSEPRETNFFISDLDYKLGAIHYERTFFADTQGAKAVGEKTPGYLFYPPCARRIRAILGARIKLIAILRSPAARANSHHRHNYMLCRENLTFEEAIHIERQRTANDPIKQAYFGYMLKGDYLTQLQRYFAIFPRENILAVRFDDLQDDQDQTIKRVCDFLEISVPAGDYVARGRPKQQFLAIEKGSGTSVDIRFERDNLILRDPSRKSLEFARKYIENFPSLRSLTPDEEKDLNNHHHHDAIRRLEDLLKFDLRSWLPS